MVNQLNDLMKALEAGSYNAAPSSLQQGSALQIEDLSPVMENVCFDDKQIKLQKMFSVKDAKGTLVQFNRQLDYGIFGGSAQYEGGIGEEDTSNYSRITIPMAYYSTVRRVSVAANLVAAFDGQKAETRAGNDAAIKLSADIEFDGFRGQADFSNSGVFDGNPAVIADVPGMQGVDMQVRLSDSLSNTQDLMFAEYGSNQTVVIAVNGTLTESFIEDGAVKSAMNHGSADKLMLDPISLSAYNKIAHAKERIMLAGSAQEAMGANLRTQWTSNGTISLEPSRFLSGKTAPARSRAGSPAAPATVTPTAANDAASILAAGDYYYKATACNERGESVSTSSAQVSPTAGQKVTLAIAAVTGCKYFNVYRSADGGTAAAAKFIGRVKASGSGATSFVDLGFKEPGSVTGFLLQTNTFGFHQLAPYSRLKLALHDLSLPEAHFSFKCLAGYQPRKNVLFENISGQLS
ncbi:MAG TPA: hypothetical protein VI911_11805 [Patescibacteria group bacterium]|nr:hypothetical protein [Patescibacteria group bacterium]